MVIGISNDILISLHTDAVYVYCYWPNFSNILLIQLTTSSSKSFTFTNPGIICRILELILCRQSD